jgi:hypothetical protein
MKVDPADPTKAIAYDKLTVIDLEILAAESPGHAAGRRRRRFDQRTATLAPVTEAKIGHWCQGIVWSKDSKNLLVQCMVQNEIATFGFDGKTLTKTAPIAMKVSPAGIRTAEP